MGLAKRVSFAPLGLLSGFSPQAAVAILTDSITIASSPLCFLDFRAIVRPPFNVHKFDAALYLEFARARHAPFQAGTSWQI
jgi:hypothetical protein